ncbi:unnamed protein product [Rhizoctonia solani]|uniref:AAA+ ATPase domain-containing protein n=1 Tax=Rhizoctonia solani TaxID=456999 RepID=A0A8H3GUB8_9AGAM|nr:unnamed protein product [Rhizoctonia solani]
MLTWAAMMIWRQNKSHNTKNGTKILSAMTKEPAQSDLEFQNRKIGKRHFIRALKQVRSSTSEKQAPLVELRRWNKQFGSGNQPNRAGGFADGKIPPISDEDDRSGGTDSSSTSDTPDPIIEWAKTQELNSYQEDLLGCIIRPAEIRTGFDSVHLPDATIDTMRTMVSLRLICPEAFNTGILKQYNMSGALLFGPPGTGKTHMVKAIAKESGARMISVKPSDIANRWVGETEKSIDALFKLARLLKPCIIFIDEVDALFGARVATKEGYSRWRTDMLTQFTQEMDGMQSSDVIVIGATNRPFDLDDAIIRRFPSRILVDLPDYDAREAILDILLKNEQLDPDVALADLASLTPNFSGSDLKHLCIAAAFESVKERAHVSWIKKKERSNSISSPFGISSPAELDPDTGSPSSVDPTEVLTKSSTLNNDVSQSQLEPQTRTLERKHFTRALKQVRASTSETQSSLVELRRWNDQFGSGNQPNRTGGSEASGLNLPGLNQGSNYHWMNGSGKGTSGPGTPGVHSSGLNPPGTNGAGTSMSSMNLPGVNSSAGGVPGVNSHGLTFAPPVEGSYLRSLGVKF